MIYIRSIFVSYIGTPKSKLLSTPLFMPRTFIYILPSIIQQVASWCCMTDARVNKHYWYGKVSTLIELFTIYLL